MIKRKSPIEKKLKGMTFAATSRCPCGRALAYDKTCVMAPSRRPSYWDCSGILLGTADPGVQHTDHLPFAFYEIKSEFGHVRHPRPSRWRIPKK